LVDSLNKRINFLQEVISEINLSNIKAYFCQKKFSIRGELYDEKKNC